MVFVDGRLLHAVANNLLYGDKNYKKNIGYCGAYPQN